MGKRHRGSGVRSKSVVPAYFCPCSFLRLEFSRARYFASEKGSLNSQVETQGTIIPITECSDAATQFVQANYGDEYCPILSQGRKMLADTYRCPLFRLMSDDFRIAIVEVGVQQHFNNQHPFPAHREQSSIERTENAGIAQDLHQTGCVGVPVNGTRHSIIKGSLFG